MGYFSNGTEGEAYYDRWCSTCVHEKGGCAVWLAHLMANYKECNNEDSILHYLIPRSKDGLRNEKCKMHHEMTPAQQKAIEARAKYEATMAMQRRTSTKLEQEARR